MRSQNFISLLTIISFVWHLCYKVEVAADIFVNASRTALSSPIGQGISWTWGNPPTFPGPAGDINDDTYPDLMLPYYQGGIVYIIFGTANGIPQLDAKTMVTPTQGITITGSSTTHFGFTTAYVGDVNGDDIDDILIGNDGTGTAAYVIFGKSGGTLTNVVVTSMSSDQGITLTGVTSFGKVVASAGDVNGDGKNDMLVSAISATNPSGVASGVAYVIFGGKNGLASMSVDSLTTSQGFKVYGSVSGQNFGSGLSAAGDVNNDGVVDFMVGADKTVVGTTAVGMVGVFYGRKTDIADISIGTMDASKGYLISGYGTQVRPIGSAYTMAPAGDVNGDGIGDMIIAQPTFYQSGVIGKVFIVYGQQGTSGTAAGIDTAAGFLITGTSAGNLGGGGVASGDINNDGILDLVMSSYTLSVPSEIAGSVSNTASAGRVLVFFGHGGGFSSFNLAQNETNYPQVLEYYGLGNTQFGGSVTVGDVNGDGVDDIIATSKFNTVDTALLYGTTCSVSAKCSDSSLHPVCYASLGCECGKISKKFQLNQCVDQCSDGYYQNEILCQSCPSTCATCTDANTCQTCKSPNLLQGTSCVASCSQGYTQSGTNCIVAFSCPSTCATCSSATTCLTCNGANLLQETSCVASCDPGYYQSGTKCLACPSTCATCTGANTCQTCKGTNLLQDGSCVASCDPGYFKSGTSCIGCPNTCATCTSSTTCQTCSGTNLLQDTSCVASCDPGYFKSGTSCTGCPSTCATCTGSSTCQTCKGANLLQGTSCVATCDPGYYKSGASCIGCPNTCATCTSPTTCQTCSGTNLLQGTSCVANCDPGYTPSGSNCCPSTCATCTAGNVCLTCSGTNLLQGTSCVASCDPGYTQSGTNCIANSNTGGNNSGGPSSNPDTITAGSSSSNHTGLIIGVVVGVVVLVIGMIAAFYFKGAIIAKFTRAGTAAKYASSASNKPTVQITDGEEFVRLDTAKGDGQSPRSPLSPQSPQSPSSPNSQTSRFFPQSTQTLQVLKVEVDP